MYEVEQTLVRTVLLAFLDDDFYSAFAQTLYGTQAEANVSAHVHTELAVTLVYVRTQAKNAHGLALAHQFGDFGDVGQVAAHIGSHVFGGEVGFQIGGLICHPRIACGMALVEGIGGKLFPVCPYLFQFSRVMAVGFSLIDELRLHLVQLLSHLFTHGLTQRVAFASGKVGQLAAQKHHLLLVYCNAVRVLQVFFHARNVVFHRLPSVLTVNEVGDIVHWTWTVQRVHGNQVFKGRRLQFAQIFLHTCRFELECADGASVTIELVGGIVFYVQSVHIHIQAKTFLYVGHTFLYGGQVLQSQEVHLDEACVFDYGTFVLRTAQSLSGFLVFCCADGHPV